MECYNLDILSFGETEVRGNGVIDGARYICMVEWKKGE